MAGLFASTWGDPNATKHALLIHGLSSSSLAWHRVAPELASQGCFVTAPDLLGHGHAKRGSDYTVAALVNELLPFLTPAKGGDHPYDIVVGQSLGAIVVAALLPHLKSTRPVNVVLVDPPLEVAPDFHAMVTKDVVERLGKPNSPEQYQQENPSWSREETIVSSTSDYLCDFTAATAILAQNWPWSFSHLLLTAPDNVKLTVLAADPSMADRCVTVEQLKPYPHVTAKVVWGAPHNIPRVMPRAIVEAALGQN